MMMIIIVTDRAVCIVVDLVSTYPGVVFVVLLSHPQNTRIFSAAEPQPIPYSYFSSHYSLTTSFDSAL